MIDTVRIYLENLTATDPVVLAWGERFVLKRNLFLFIVPPSPTNIITLSPYGSAAPDVVRPVLHPNLQIRLRNESPLVSYNTAMAMIKAFHQSNALVKGLCFALNSSPLPLGLDAIGRQEYAINFTFKYIYV